MEDDNLVMKGSGLITHQNNKKIKIVLNESEDEDINAIDEDRYIRLYKLANDVSFC